MANITQSLSQIIQQVFVPKIDYFRCNDSWLWQNIKGSMRKVNMDHIGQNWQVVWPFRLGLGGAVDWAQIGGPDMATTPGSLTTTVGSEAYTANTPPGFQQYSGLETWPGIDETTVPAFVQRILTLKKMKVDFHVPIQIIRAAQLGASIGDQMEFTVDSVAENVAHNQMLGFLGQSQTVSSVVYRGQIGSFATGATPTLDASTPLTVNLDSGTAIQRFQSGLRVDIYKTGTTTRLNDAGPVFIDKPDPFKDAGSALQGEVTLYVTNSASYVFENATYMIVLRNSGRHLTQNNIPTSLDDLLVASGSIYGVPLASYPILKSYVPTGVSGALSEPKLLKWVARYQHARGKLHQFDTLVGSEGLFAGFFQDMLTLPTTSGTSYGSAIRYDRNGTIMKVTGGVAEAVTFNLYGRTYNLVADSFVTAGTLYGVKLRDGNFQIVRPPRIPGTGSQGGFDGALEFLAPLFGGRGIFLPFNAVGGGSGGAFTNFLHAPAEMPYEIIPESIPGMKVSGLDEFYGEDEA